MFLRILLLYCNLSELWTLVIHLLNVFFFISVYSYDEKKLVILQQRAPFVKVRISHVVVCFVWWCLNSIFRSSPSQMFHKVGISKSVAKFTGKHLCPSVFFADLWSVTLLKKRLRHRCFPGKFSDIFRNTFI